MKQCVVESQAQRLAGRREPRGQELGEAQPELVGRPAGGGEEAMGARVMEDSRKARRLPHPADGALADLGGEAHDQPAEGVEARRREARAKQGREGGERIRDNGRRRHDPSSRRCEIPPWIREAVGAPCITAAVYVRS